MYKFMYNYFSYHYYIELIGAVVASYLFAIVYEGLKTMREWLLYYDIQQLKQQDLTTKRIARSGSNKTRGKDDDRLQLVEDKFKKPNRLVHI